MGLQRSEWEDLLGRMQMWVSVREERDRVAASEIRSRKTKARMMSARGSGSRLRNSGLLNQLGSNQVVVERTGVSWKRGRARRLVQCEEFGDEGHRRTVWKSVAAEGKVRSEEEDTDCER